MRRIIKRAADIARVAGIALICVAVVLSIYVTASVNKPWGEFSAHLREAGADAGFGTRLRFDGAYYGALSRAAAEKGQSDEVRAEHIRPRFAPFERKLEKALSDGKASEIQSLWAYFDNEFDAQAFMDVHAQAENGHEVRELKDIVEYLDGLAAVPAKGKAAKLKAASNEPWLKEQYDALVAAQGDAAGSYLEFMRALQHLAGQYLDGGNKIKDLKAWYAEQVTEAAYAEALSAVRAEEREEAAASLSDRVAEAIEGGRGARAALEEIWSEIKGDVGDGQELSYLASMRALLSDETFDGTLKTLTERMAEEAQAAEANSASAFMDGWCLATVAEADNRSAVSVVAAFWWVVSKFLILWALGVALVVLGVAADKLLARYMLKRMDRAGIQEDPDVLLRVENLCQYFRSGDHVTKAVDDVSFFVKKGEVFGLVGESGCGKTTTGRTIINLYDPTAGNVYFDGLRISSGRNGLPVLSYTLRQDAKARIAQLKDDLKEQCRQRPEAASKLKAECRDAIRAVRRELSEKLAKAQDDALEADAEKSKAVQLYRQHRRDQLTKAYEEEAKGLSGQALEDRKRRWEVEMKAASKDNVMTRMQMIFQDPIASIDPRMTVREIIAEGLHIRGITDKKIIDKKVYEMLDLVGLVSEHADRYPHEFSGGQRQRIGIARAIALEPEMIIADEPISALDVSIQAQVINLLNDLRNRMGLTIIFIAHNLSVVKYFSDRIAVMYFGNIVEMTTSEELFEHPLHPYTRSLLSAIPYPDPHYEKQRKRLEYNPARAHDYSVDKPTLREIKPGHWIRCNDAEFEKYRQELGL